MHSEKLAKLINEIIGKIDPDVAFAIGAGRYENDSIERLLAAEGLIEHKHGYWALTKLGDLLRDSFLAKIDREHPAPEPKVAEREPEEVEPAEPAATENSDVGTTPVELPAKTVAYMRTQPAPAPLPHGYTPSDVTEF